MEINLNWTALLRKPIQVTLIGVKVQLEYTEHDGQPDVNVEDAITRIEENIESQAKT